MSIDGVVVETTGSDREPAGATVGGGQLITVDLTTEGHDHPWWCEDDGAPFTSSNTAAGVHDEWVAVSGHSTMCYLDV